MASKPVKVDRINRKILATLHLEADLTNVELAERVNLSPSACFQRVKALKEAGYFKHFHAEVDLDQLCEHMLAYVEFTLADNGAPARRRFEAAIAEIPEIMDCLRVAGDIDYISFTCFPNVDALNACCDRLTDDPKLAIRSIRTRIVVERAKWFFGYPLDQLTWHADRTG
ncbi:Lrp/AsnC family transcriptional regulator [Ferrimonas marina]|uniref:Lrp/AsnC family transcriptional regulator, leucine-responsive regulatory protein n=1 Tax=Ferrimonas marina TaxID=299255 RepID=A0A1M5RXP9_9GAMM|nr:Lrp/AsnC family transcriptional regulator [Ferrimonas marina]SHH31132.1 Lrp/AsnC family transcriptional regulator, leucine-responsive regulatory protein [Ferrimonas marina]